MKKHFATILCGLVFMLASCGDGGDTATTEFRVSAPVVSDITQRSVHVKAEASFAPADYRNITVGFLYGMTTESVATQYREIAATSEGRTIAADITGLNAGADYTVYAIFRQNGVRTLGEATQFRTAAAGGGDEKPELEVVSDSEITFDAAGGSSAILYNIYYAPDKASAVAVCDAAWITLDDSRSGRVEVVAAKNDGQRRSATVTLSYGECRDEIVSIEQLGADDDPLPVEPTFGTPSIGSITAESAAVSCAVDYSGTDEISSMAFVYKVTGGAEQRYTLTASTGTKSATLTGLSASTSHTVCLEATIGGNSYRSSSMSFTTLSANTGGGSGARYTGWAELPAEVEKSGDYYYAYHRRADKQSVRNYSVCYSAEMRSAVWTAMPIHSSYDGGAGRNDSWGYDPIIPRNVQPVLKSSYSGVYSRGHMVASSDRQVSVSTNQQTFYYTNMAPQYQNEFNGGIWQKLENWCWDEQNCSDTLYVVTGAHYANKNKTCSDNDGKSVVVPTHFYKLLIRSKSGRTGKPLSQLSASDIKCVGFWFEHNQSYGTKEKPSSKYMKSVADIEKLTGMTFFPNVPNAPKSSYSASEWGM